MTGKELVQQERDRHVSLGYTVESDKENYPNKELAEAAQYVLGTLGIFEDRDIPPGWDSYLGNIHLKPRLERFIIAGALFLAQIDVDDRVTYDYTLENIYRQIEILNKHGKA